MTPKMEAKEKLAKQIIKKMELRGMEGYFAETKEDAVKVFESLLEPGKSVAWGGSETLTECGIMDYLATSDMKIIDRMKYKTEEEVKECNSLISNCDYFLMSSNAITMDGMLVNIDGRGNRVSYLIYGPEKVIVVAGMNKVAKDVEAAVERARDFASPANAIRLKRKTPCANLGRCGDCLSEDCICANLVVTRRSHIKNRIQVILVGEELGF